MFLLQLAAALPSSRRFFRSSSSSSYSLANAIAEMNKEMEMVFGDLPPPGLGSAANESLSQAPPTQILSNQPIESLHTLTHTSKTGEAQMVDVSQKPITKRTAIASCKVLLGKEVFNLVSANQLAKGDVLSVAKLAGIGGAKNTSNLIPLCHNILLSHVRVDLKLNSDDFSVEIEGEAVSTGKTGVEMEALTAVSVAGLTVYDMCKAASKDIEISSVRLDSKTGGKSGDWFRQK